MSKQQLLFFLLQTCDLKRTTMIFNYHYGIYVVVNLIE